MDRYKETFNRLKKEKRSAFIPFTVIGDPDYKTSLEIVKTFVRGGADILELGIPFSDPIADGPVNQKAGLRSLKMGMNTKKVFRFIQDIRKFTRIPIGLLCYYNTILSFGITKFYATAGECGADSILVADASIEESDPLIQASRRSPVKTVFIISELSDKRRIKKIAKRTTAFIYLVSRLGVTGTQKNLNKNILKSIKRIRKVTPVPICVGFGISKPSHVRNLTHIGADGIICGSAIVKRIEDSLNQKKDMLKNIESFVKAMRRAR